MTKSLKKIKNKNLEITKLMILIGLSLELPLIGCGGPGVDSSAHSPNKKEGVNRWNYGQHNSADLCQSAISCDSPLYGGGDGTKSNPYLICTAKQFQAIQGDNFDKRYFKITQDIDFSNLRYYTIPYGSPRASIDGDNHTLRNLTLDYNDNENGVTLFGNLTRDYNNHRDEVKNLILENVSILGNGTPVIVGVVAAYNYDGVIHNVHIKGQIKILSDHRSPLLFHGVGGLVGVNEGRGEIIDSSFDGAIQAEKEVGGIAGINRGQIRNCEFRGKVTGTSEVGGIAGIQEDQGSIENSRVQGEVEGLSHFGTLFGIQTP